MAPPPAQLSNDELLAQAVTNMQALQSYHYDFAGLQPSLAVSPPPSSSP